MTTTDTTPNVPVVETPDAAPTLCARAGRFFSRRPVAMGAATLTAIAWTSIVYGFPYTEAMFPFVFPALLAAPVVIPTLLLAHARRNWWRAVAVPVLVFSIDPSAMVPITIAALAWFWYRTFYADAPWVPADPEDAP